MIPDLPAQLTRFIGRERELAEVLRLVGTMRLLTLTGAGGSGKTRLAREAAARAAEAGLYERVGWVDLASLADRALVPEQTATALRVPERAGASATDSLRASIGDTPTLLVLDNCEHLVEACAGFVQTLLLGCPRLTVLATSREALGVPGETAWLVPPLERSEAVQLFVERAQGSLASFSVTDANAPAVGEICRRVDGIPLAIELAAARIRVLSAEQIAGRLDDAFRLLSSGSRTALPRHRTLRGAMDWSYALLADRERVLLHRLSVFSGSFSLEAAEVVCAGAPLEEEDILDGVAALVDKSLVVMESSSSDVRYRLLETVRQYAEERLRSAGELSRLKRQHAEFFVHFAESAEPYLFAGAGNARWIARVKEENGNLRALAAWAEDDESRTEIALRLCYATNWFWFATGQFHEAQGRLTTALSRSVGCDPDIRGRALLASGNIGIWQGRHTDVRPRMEEAYALLRDHADARTVACALIGICAGYVLEGDPVSAGDYAERALDAARSLRPHALHSFILYWRGWAAQARGDLQMARESFEQAAETGRRIGHGPAIAHSLAMLGRVAHAQGDYEEAFARYTESIAIHAETEDAWGIMLALEGLGSVAVARERHKRAARLLGAADALRERIVSELTPPERAERERLLAILRDSLGAQMEPLWQEGKALSMQGAVDLALADPGQHTAEHRVVVMDTFGPTTEMEVRPTLRVLALGPLEVFVGDRPVDPADWGSARPRELLVFLLIHPEGVTKEQVGLAFWPEASAAQLRNSFHVTLHRLRKALHNPDWITLTGERYRVDPGIVRELDVAAFEREVAAARRGLKRKEEGAAAALEQALGRYRGDLLDGEPAGDWHLEHRDRLQRVYVDALMELGAQLEREERHAKAADLYRRVLARDELHEDATHALMSCHARMGERTQAIRVYQRFADKLRTELEAEPDEEMRELVEQIRAG